MVDKSPQNFHSPTGLVRSDEPLARTEFNSPRATGRALVSSPAVVNILFNTHCRTHLEHLYSFHCHSITSVGQIMHYDYSQLQILGIHTIARANHTSE